MNEQKRSGITSRFNDKFSIPYGKVNLSASTPVANQNYVDAFASNLEIKIGNDTIQPSVVATGNNNQFYVTSQLQRSYFGETATLSLKNQGLVRSGAVASQVSSVSKPVYIYVCALPS